MADRSVTIAIKARVTDLVRGLRASASETTNLGRKMTETGASADRMRQRLEAATKKLPKIEIDADSTPAEVKFAQLRSQLETLSTKRIGIDIDEASATAQIQTIQRELERLESTEASVNVRADIGSALAELRAVQSEASRLDGKTAHVRVNADVAGALSGIATVGMALAALPAAVTIGASVAALGGAFAVAGAGAVAFGAAAIPSLGRVNDALKQQQTAAGGAGGAVKSAGQAAAEAASKSLQLAQAQDRVADAARGVKDAVAGVARAQEDAAQAAASAAERQAQAGQRIEAAERSVAEAHRSTQRALEDLSRARDAAAEHIEDLALATEGGALSEERAQISIARAKADLARVNANKGSSDLDKQDAALRLREAELGLKRVQEANGDLAKEQAKVSQQGIEGSDQVKAAKEGVESAARREADAERALGDARIDAAKVAVAGARDVAEANRRVAEAQGKIGEAQRDQLRATQQLKVLQLQQAAALEQTGGAAGGAASKMAALSKTEKALAKDITSFKDGYKAWQDAVAPDVLPAISQGLGLVSDLLPRIEPGARGAGKALTTLGKEARKALKEDPFWDEFFDDMNKEIPDAILSLGRTGGNVFKGFAGVIHALLPYGRDLLGNIEDLSGGFAEWGTGLGEDSNFRRFMRQIEENGPAIWETLKNVAITGGNIVEALAPFGVGALGGLSLLAKLTAGMSPEHIQGIALAVGAIYLAVKSGQAINSGVTALGRLRDRIGEVGSASGGSKTKLGGLMSFLGAGGPWGIALAAGTFAVGQFALGHYEAEQRIKDMAQALRDSKGAITDDMRTKISQTLIDDGILEAAQKLGINLNLVTEAATGDQRAINELNKELGKHQTAVMGSAGKLGTFSTGQKQLSENALLVMEAVNGQTGEIAESRRQAALATVANVNYARAYDETKKALDAAGGSLDITSEKTESQRRATEAARLKFGEYVTAVRDAATAQATLTGKQEDGRTEVLKQLQPLMELAGNNKKAKDEIYKLAESYGVSKRGADIAASGAEGLRKTLAKLKPVKIPIDLDTKKAIDSLGALLKLISTKKPVVTVGVLRPEFQNANGNVYKPYANGGMVRSFAAGSERHVAQIGRPGMIRVWNEPETQGESYIPHAMSKRGRSMDILRATAARFGQQVVPAGPSKVSSTFGSLGSAGASSSVLTVNLDNADAIVVSLDSTTRAMTAGLGSASSTLTSAMGSSGTLTVAVGDLGDAAHDLGGALSDAVSDLASEIRALSNSVSVLSSAVTAAGSVAASARSTASGRAASTQPIRRTTATVAGAPKAKPKAKAKAKAKPPPGGGSRVPTRSEVMGAQPGRVEPVGASYVDENGVLVIPMADGGLVSSPRILAGEAGREMVVPLSAAKRARGLETLRSAAGLMGQTVMPKFTSMSTPRYVQGGSSRGSTFSAEQVSAMVRQAVTEAVKQMPRRGLSIENYHEAEGGSARQTAEELNFIERRS